MRVTLAQNITQRIMLPIPGQTGIMLQVITTGAQVFFSTTKEDLDNVNCCGVPSSGWSLDSTRGPQQLIGINDAIYARPLKSAAGIQVEIVPLGVVADHPPTTQCFCCCGTPQQYTPRNKADAVVFTLKNKLKGFFR